MFPLNNRSVLEKKNIIGNKKNRRFVIYGRNFFNKKLPLVRRSIVLSGVSYPLIIRVFGKPWSDSSTGVLQVPNTKGEGLIMKLQKRYVLDDIL